MGQREVDDIGANGSGYFDGEECPRQVEHGGQGNSHLRPECTGGDGRCHRVSGVMEAIREVENERRAHHEHQDDDLFHVSRSYWVNGS